MDTNLQLKLNDILNLKYESSHPNRSEDYYYYFIIKKCKNYNGYLSLLKKFKEANCDYIFHNIAFLTHQKLHHLTNSYFTFDVKRDGINFLVYSYLVQKENIHFPVQKHFTNEYFCDLFKKNIHVDNFNSYKELLKNGSVEYINFSDYIKSLANNETTKKVLNYLIDSYEMYNESYILDIIEDKYKKIKLIDPLFGGISTTKLINLLNNNKEHNYINKIQDITSSNPSIFDETNIFQIQLNLDSITTLNKNFNQSKKTILNLHLFFADAQTANSCNILESYQSKKSEIEMVTKKTKMKKNQHELSFLLKSFEFSYDNIEDKTFKEKVLKDFIKNVISYKVNKGDEILSMSEMDKMYQAIKLKHLLETDNNTLCLTKKINKI